MYHNQPCIQCSSVDGFSLNHYFFSIWKLMVWKSSTGPPNLLTEIFCKLLTTWFSWNTVSFPVNIITWVYACYLNLPSFQMTGLFVLVASNKMGVSTSSVHFVIVSWFETRLSDLGRKESLNAFDVQLSSLWIWSLYERSKKTHLRQGQKLQGRPQRSKPIEIKFLFLGNPNHLIDMPSRAFRYK